ncbi:MAG: hypothetical protein R6V62_08075 [Candidatus Fermentibacteraceae bacterium]
MKRLSAAPLFLLISCARVVAPAGGPEDTEPPLFVGSQPPPGRSVILPQQILLEWSERIEPFSAVPLIFPDTPHSVVFGGRTMEIKLESPPRGTMLTLLLPGGLSDTRGNGSLEPLNLVWTTADTASTSKLTFQASLQGGGEAPPAAVVRLQSLPDTTVFTRGAFPDTLGYGEIPWLAPGSYRILVFDDRDGSRTWEDQTEPGVATEFSLEPGSMLHLDLVMAVVDTVGPSISVASALNTHQILLEWNEELSRTVPLPDRFRIMSVGDREVELLGVSHMPGRTRGRLLLHTAGVPDTLITLYASGISDLMGNTSRPDSISFWGTDTLPAEEFAVVSVFPADGLSDVNPAGPYTISLNAWVPLDSLASCYSITRVSDSTRIEGTWNRPDAVTFIFTPDQHLSGQRQHRVDIEAGLVTLWGDSLPAQSWVFSTAWSTLPGSVQGTLSGTARETMLVLTPAGGEGQTRTETVTPGAYTLDAVPGGRYTLAAFVDTNGNGSWDSGEPYGAWPGVLEVLPGFPTLEVDIAVLP